MSDNKQFLLINIEDKIVPATLSSLLNRSPSLMYQWAQMGRLPDFKNGTYNYRECIDQLVTVLLREKDTKMAKAQENARLRKQGLDTIENIDDTMHPLVAAKLKQNIKTEIAREADLWQKIAIKRGEYVNFADKLDLVEGFVTSIRDKLLYLGNNYPEIQGQIDEAMEELFQLGVTLCEEAEIDANNYIDTMLAMEPDIDNG